MKLDDTQNQLTRIDRDILALLAERFTLVSQAVARKVPGAEMSEDELSMTLRRLAAIPQDAVPAQAVRAVFREILSASWSLQEPVNIAFLGPVATYTHQAALGKFGAGVSYLPQRTIADVFDAVTRGNVKYGVVPVENSTEGAVTHTLDMFADTVVKICAEMNMPIHHNLMCRCRPQDLRLIYSHPQVFGQCRQWLHKNLPAADLVEVSSTTEAARRCAAEPGTGALAGVLAAEQYDLPVQQRNIEDCMGNTTRFMVLGRGAPEPSGDDKTSIMFVVKHRVGALYDSLLPLKRHDINMTFIESRPSKQRNWEYYFFVDFLGHTSEESVRQALEDLSEHCQFMKILGSYPRAVEGFA